MFLGGQDTTLDIADGCIGPRGNISGGERTLGTSPELDKWPDMGSRKLSQSYKTTFPKNDLRPFLSKLGVFLGHLEVF